MDLPTALPMCSYPSPLRQPGGARGHCNVGYCEGALNYSSYPYYYHARRYYDLAAALLQEQVDQSTRSMLSPCREGSIPSYSACGTVCQSTNGAISSLPSAVGSAQASGVIPSPTSAASSLPAYPCPLPICSVQSSRGTTAYSSQGSCASTVPPSSQVNHIPAGQRFEPQHPVSIPLTPCRDSRGTTSLQDISTCVPVHGTVFLGTSSTPSCTSRTTTYPLPCATPCSTPCGLAASPLPANNGNSSASSVYAFTASDVLSLPDTNFLLHLPWRSSSPPPASDTTIQPALYATSAGTSDVISSHTQRAASSAASGSPSSSACEAIFSSSHGAASSPTSDPISSPTRGPILAPASGAISPPAALARGGKGQRLPGKPKKCPYCCKILPSRYAFKKHVLQDHNSDPFPPRHLVCEVCNKVFATVASLRQHQVIHSGDKPHQCPECARSFADKSTLVKHQRIHSGQRPYRCQLCDRGFTQSGNLKRHCLRVHALRL